MSVSEARVFSAVRVEDKVRCRMEFGGGMRFGAVVDVTGDGFRQRAERVARAVVRMAAQNNFTVDLDRVLGEIVAASEGGAERAD